MAQLLEGLNPKPPASVPVLPFSATPANWTRTEYNTPGDFVFTPATDTSLILAVLQGAGSGGHVKQDLLGNVIAYASTADGEDTTVTNADGLFYTATGAKRLAPGNIEDKSTVVPVDWVRKIVGSVGAIGSEIAPSATAAAGTGATQISGVVGSAWTQAVITPKIAPSTNFRTVDGSAQGWVVDSSNLFTRTANGWESTNKAVNTVGYIQYQNVNVSKGQVIIFRMFASANSGSFADLYLNGTRVTHQVGTLNGVVVYTYTAPEDGALTVRFEFTRGADAALNANAAYLQQIDATNSNYPATLSGSNGRYSSLYVTPQVLNLRIGAGGKGIASGQTIPAGAKGTRGAGGAAGGDGGDGVIVIYEFKGTVPFENPVEPLTLTQINVQSEVVGFYRTEYTPRGFAVDGLQSAFTHKLRPRTKSVIALIVGAGGHATNAVSSTVNAGDTTISTTTKQYTAGGGWSSFRIVSQSEGAPGNGGVFSGTTEPVLYKDGNRGSTVTSSTANPSGIVAGFGNGVPSQYIIMAGSGAGAYAIVVFTTDSFNADRTLDLLVGNTTTGGTGGGQGAVFLYETEYVFGTYITQAAELVLQKSAIPRTNITQTAELVLRKSVAADRRTTQVAELILVKDSDDVDLQVSNAYVALVFDADYVTLNVTQAAELVLQKSAKPNTAVTQTAELVLQKTGRSPYRTTQVAELFLVSETPTVFWLNFGTLEAPVRFQLYDSAVGRASSVPQNCKIQIEGFYAPGTQLFINGVASGTLANVHNNDRVYIHGGVTNYWQSNIPVYAYYEENDETARMLVGNWIIEQPELIPLVTKAYYGPKTTQAWFKTRTRASLVQLAMTAVQNKFGSFVDLMQEKTGAISRVAEVTMGWGITKALSKVSDSYSWIGLQALSVDVQNVMTWGTHKAQVSEFKQTDFIATKAEYVDETMSYELHKDGSVGHALSGESILLSVNYAHFETATEQTQAGYGAYIVDDFELTNAAYTDVVQEYEYNNVDHSVTYEVVYVAIQSSSISRLFSMEPMGTIAYSVLSDTTWERSTAHGTGYWKVPTYDALNTQAKFGMFSVTGVDTIQAHSAYSERETEAINGPQQGYYGTTPLWSHTYSVHADHETSIKRSEKTAVFTTDVDKTAAKTGVFNLTPFLAMQKPNGIGKASLYKGFDTKAEVDQFTENFAGVHTALKYNGYVYTLDVDKSFICEIFNNGPVKWLLQGG